MSPPHPQTTETSRAREDALDWFVRRNDAGFTAADERSFQAWLAADASHTQAFAAWQGEWQRFDDIPDEARAQLKRHLAQDDAAMAATAGNARSRQPTRAGAPRKLQATRWSWMPGFALAALLVVSCSAGILAWNVWQAQPLYTQAFASQRGQQREVALEDGSQVRLDTDTRIEVTYYRKRREVTLSNGQAMFRVQPDTTRPFQVMAGPMRVTVVGTRFAVRNVTSSLGDEGPHVAVEEGKVKVEQVQAGVGSAASVVYLTAGQQIGADTSGRLGKVSAVTDIGIAAWRQHRVSFDNTRLDRALAELGRYGETHLVVRDPAVAALRLTGVFDPRDPATFRRVLPLSLPVRLKDVDGATEVRPAR